MYTNLPLKITNSLRKPSSIEVKNSVEEILNMGDVSFNP